jgi:2-C-methyl-D-erythritol 2,4-cyclodiphosphate synthase
MAANVFLPNEVCMRVGIGYDIHRLVEGRELILGGVSIPFAKGLQGHSDADALTHAICDALLGAAGLGDIGLFFPDTDARYKGIDSLKLLADVNKMIKESEFSILNLDATVFAEAPKIAPYRRDIQKKIAATIQINPNNINIKATTAEGLGVIGRGDAIAAMCVALVQEL